MSSQKSVSIEIPAALLLEIQQLIVSANAKLAPYLVALTPQERQGLPKMADKTVAFVTKALQFAQSNPEFAPAYLDVPALQTDVKAVQDLTSLEHLLENLVSQLNDTIMLSGSEAYVAGLTYYQSAKVASNRNVPGAKIIYDDLSQRFDFARKKAIKAA